MNSRFGFDRDWPEPGKPGGQATADDLLGNVLAGGVKQFSQVLANDPLLRTMDQMWNANPFHEIVPVDWAKLARALRTVWLQSLGMPESLSSALTLNAELWSSAMEAWNDAAARRG